MITGIVGGDANNIKLGNFEPNPKENILVYYQRDVLIAKDINCLSKGNKFIFDNSIGYYIIKEGDDIRDKLLLYNRGKGAYPYNIEKFYNAEFQLNAFKNHDKFDFKSKYGDLLKYTIGVEFEASAGYLPQEKCFQLGLIPLRDGSITSVEYATIVLDRTKLGLLKKQVEELSKYTEFDKECSLHIHFGNYPITPAAAFSLYKVCKALETYLYHVLPKYTFKTSLYKRTRKDYCKLLPNLGTFKELYSWAADYEAEYAGSLFQNHPNDPEKRGKWNIHSRYFWSNFVNLLFYRNCKTFEFRMLRPTYNFNKIIFWIYSFNAILLYAEHIANNRNLNEVEAMVINDLTLPEIFRAVYPPEFAERMCIYDDLDRYITCTQHSQNDFIGSLTEFEDVIFENNVIE